MSFLTDALDELVATLVSVGETVADSAAAIRPPVAVVDPPTVSTVSGTIFTVDWLVTLTEQPPGSDRAVRRLLDRVATIGAVLPISSASPTVYSVAGTDLPGMSLTIQLTYRSGAADLPAVDRALPAFLWDFVGSYGVTVTTGATPHEYGSWAQLTASVPETSDVFNIYATTGSSSLDTATLLEVGIGPPGSETPVISNLPIGGWTAQNDVPLPFHIPAGSRVSYRLASLQPSRNVGVYGVFSKRSPFVRESAHSATVYGVDVATSSGTEITSGTIHELGTISTTARYISVLPSLSNANTNSGTTTWNVYTGPAGAETLLGRTAFNVHPLEWAYVTFVQSSRSSFPGPFPAGTRVSVELVSGVPADAALIAYHS